MKARPILFSGPMVKALLEGRKTQTRRVVKPQPILDTTGFKWIKPLPGERMYACVSTNGTPPPGFYEHCPYGKPGDLLWVRENVELLQAGSGPCVGQGYGFEVHYKTDGHKEWCWATPETLPKTLGNKPNIHMHRWASRLTLGLTDVRVQRLQDISYDDAKAEGCKEDCSARGEYRHMLKPDAGDLGRSSTELDFIRLWESINGPGSWDANPWVWALTFTVHQCNVNDLLKGKNHD